MAEPNATFLAGRVRIRSGQVVRIPEGIRYRVVLRNTSDESVSIRFTVRFFDDAGVEYRKGDERWETVTLPAGRDGEIEGVFAMSEPTRVGLEVKGNDR